jgi:heme A synthase
MSRFSKYAWFIVAFLILVILWGAVVRATGSGAGCGNHWPSCNGEIIPTPEAIETMIEFGHRVTSSLSGLLIIFLLVWAFRGKFAVNQRFIRAMAIMTFIFILIEGGLGAALVRFELVAENSSSFRAVMVALHLGNTLILLAFATLTAWAATIKETISFGKMNPIKWGVVIALVAYIFLASIGAVTALGDTLFPVETLAEGIQQDLDPTAHFLIDLRIYHPIVAIVVSVYLFAYAYWIRRKPLNASTERALNWMNIVIILQIIAGFVNVALLAPIWMQLLHLALADSLWIILVLLAGYILGTEQNRD